MKKVILYNFNDGKVYKHILSKKHIVIYGYKKIYHSRSLEFYKNNSYHRPCNIGPCYRTSSMIIYAENNKHHNLYGYAYIDKEYNKKEYSIYGKKYTKKQFNKYILIYNQLSYKRNY